MVATRLGTRLLDLAVLLVLARLLTPADFGVAAIATSIVTVLESTLELPLSQALLRVEAIGRSHYDTAFTLGVLRCACLYLLLLVALWPLSSWYGDPRLGPLVLVVGVGAIARGLINPRLAEYQKAFSFWRDIAVELAGRATGATVGVVTACLTHSYWAIAAAAVTAPLVTLVASYALAPYRPRLGLVHWPLFSSFLGWLSLAQVISTMNWQSERLILARVVPVGTLGLFTTSSDLSQIPVQAVLSPIMRPLLVAFHHVRDDRARLASSYGLAVRAIMTVGLPILVGESLVAEPLVRLVLGEAWLGVVPLLRWLAPSMIPALFVLPAISLVTALGDTRDLVVRNGFEILIKLPMLWFGYRAFGLAGVALARFASEGVAAVVCMRVVRRMVGRSMGRQVWDTWPCLAASAVMVPVVLGLRATMADGFRVTGPLGELVSCTAVGAAAYGATLYGLWRLGGRPAGLEAMAIGLLAELRGRMARGPFRVPPGARGATRMEGTPRSGPAAPLTAPSWPASPAPFDPHHTTGESHAPRQASPRHRWSGLPRLASLRTAARSGGLRRLRR